MEKEKIKHLKFKKEDCEKLEFLYDCLDKTKNNKCNYNITITIDNMSRQDIDRHKKYIIQIINSFKKSNKDKKVVEYSRYHDVSDCKNSIIWINMDSTYLGYELIRDSKELKQTISGLLNRNNILIISSILSLASFQSFERSNILKVLPHISFSGELCETKEYQNLIYRYKNSNYQYDIKKEDFSLIYNSVKDDTFIKNFRLSDYLFDYSTKNYRKDNDEIINIKCFDELINEDEKTVIKKVDEKISNIDDLVGLSNVKEELNKLFNYVEFLKKHNISREDTYLNMFFLGNPGTGKTMIANVIASKLFELGFIENDEVIKVIPTDLIGEYVGHTRNKIRNILDDAKGKILFIDEAYLLYNDNYKNGNNPYMQEAIIELLKYLEDPNNITIFAGYEKEMKKIYQANPGIKSRIYKEIMFDNYGVDELYKILCNDLSNRGFVINNILNEKCIKDYIKELSKQESFGNARTMKQLSQKLIINHASNYANKKSNEELMITRYDLPNDINNRKIEMGFGE